MENLVNPSIPFDVSLLDNVIELTNNWKNWRKNEGTKNLNRNWEWSNIIFKS